MFRTRDLQIEYFRPLLPPAILLEELPLTEQGVETVARGRQEVARILRGKREVAREAVKYLAIMADSVQAKSL